MVYCALTDKLTGNGLVFVLSLLALGASAPWVLSRVLPAMISPLLALFANNKKDDE